MAVNVYRLDKLIREFEGWLFMQRFYDPEDIEDALDEIAAHCRMRVEGLVE